MTLGPDATTRSLLCSSTHLVLPCNPPTRVSPHGLPQDLVFLSPRNFFRSSWLELFGSLFQRHPADSTSETPDLFRQIPLLGRGVVVTPLTISLAIHLFAIPLLLFFLRVVPRPASEGGWTELQQQNIVYYHFTKLDTPSKFPRVSPKRPGGRPGSSKSPDRVPPAGASESLGPLFAVSHPRVPDNDHQTILQSQSLADLKIKTDVPLPNLIVAGPAGPKRPLELNANQVRPLQPPARSLPSDSSALAEIAAAPATTGMLGLSVPQPRLPVPVGGASAPAHPASAKWYGSSGRAIEAEPAGGGGDGSASLLVLGLNPSGPAQNVALPPGNRYGEFSVSPPGLESGSTVDVGNGPAAGGNGGETGAGGDASTSLGNGNYGGGGNGSGGFVSVHGSGSGSAILADPGPAPVQLVYAIPASMLLRHNKLVVSAGPIGGGGSAAYGVLPCGKIYTVFLATAQKQWSLQYCRKSQAPESAANRAFAVIHTELPILPPEAEARFDFKRFPLPPDKASKSILIRGILTEEGKPRNLEVYQGLLPVMDSAALSAFNQWTFKPAMRSGKPVCVEILLSIPMN